MSRFQRMLYFGWVLFLPAFQCSLIVCFSHLPGVCGSGTCSNTEGSFACSGCPSGVKGSFCSITTGSQFSLSSTYTGMASTKLGTSYLFYAGGKPSSSSTYSNQAFTIDTTVTWTTSKHSFSPTLTYSRVNAAAVAIDEQRVLVIGGCRTTGPTASVELCSTATWGCSSSTVSSLSEARSLPVALLVSNKVVVGGGSTSCVCLLDLRFIVPTVLCAIVFERGLERAGYLRSAFLQPHHSHAVAGSLSALWIRRVECGHICWRLFLCHWRSV